MGEVVLLLSKDAKGLYLSKAEVYKVAHHGSKSGHDDQIWNDLLVPEPLAMLAPYLRGKIETCPPTNNNIELITRLAPRSFITTRRYQEQLIRSVAINSGLSDAGIVMRRKQRPIGIVRFRKRLDAEASWREELFGPACPLSEHSDKSVSPK